LTLIIKVKLLSLDHVSNVF